MSQNFCLFYVSNLSVQNILFFLLMYPGSDIDLQSASDGPAVPAARLSRSSRGRRHLMSVRQVAADSDGRLAGRQHNADKNGAPETVIGAGSEHGQG